MKKMLIISPCAFHSKVGEAGSKTVNFYASNFENYFDITILTLVDSWRKDYVLMISEYPRVKFVANNKKKNILQRIRDYTLIRYVYPKLKLINPKYYVSNGFHQRRLRYLLMNLENKNSFDYVIVEFTSMIFQIDLIKLYIPNAKFIASCHDVTSQSAERWVRTSNSLPIKEYYIRTFRKLEKKALSKFDLLIVQSHKDKNILTKEVGLLEDIVKIITPFYDKYILPDLTKEGIVFFGAMNRIENYSAVLWFLKKVWAPFIYKSHSNLKFFVIGGGLKDDFKITAEQYKNVLLTGFVEDPSEYFGKSLSMVIPLQTGAGIKVKTIEGMSCGLPIICNQIGIEGIEAINGKHYIHCETSDEWIDTLLDLVKNPPKYKIIGQEGSKIIGQMFNLNESFFNYKNWIEIL